MPQDFVLKITLLSDIESSILLTINAESQNRIKHINVIHHFMRKIVEDRKLEINWVAGPAMLADALPKSLPV